MVFNQSFKLNLTPPTWTWLVVFLVSISGMFYLGLNPDLIAKWWLVLVVYNAVAGLVAMVFIVLNIQNLKRQTNDNIIGSKLTWAFIKIMPILVIMPILSFYIFSFQTIQENVSRSKQTFDAFNTNFITQVDGLYQGVQRLIDDSYTEKTRRLLTLITSSEDFLQGDNDLQNLIEKLANQGWACKITLFDGQGEMLSKTDDSRCNLSKNTNNYDFQVRMSTRHLDLNSSARYLEIKVAYSKDARISNFLARVRNFSEGAHKIEFSVNTSVTKKRFLIDFSSTILLAILSALMIVFRMMEQSMKPLHNLSLATKEIAAGNYDVEVGNERKYADTGELIGRFNEMARQIKLSREGLGTHNLYLETILKYSYGVIGLDKERQIQLINPIMVKMLELGNIDGFIGEQYEQIPDKYTYLQPLFAMIKGKFKQNLAEWDEQISVSLPRRQVLLTCQGAHLNASGETIGYVIIIKDISQLHQAQKQAAWGEVAVRMAHEIKNPLTPILLSAQRLRNIFMTKLSGKDLAIIDKTTNTIIAQVKSMDSMVDAFTNYANIPRIKPKSCDLNALINQSIALYDAISNINIELDLSGDIPHLVLDASSISQVVINLIKNSSEATKSQINIKITTSHLLKQDLVRLTISDDGSGFDTTILDHIFEPYTTTKTTGSGLGLAIVENIISQHDAKITAHNLQPHGAIITIDFQC